MSKTQKTTAVFPSKYYFEELQKVDPRFYVEKDLVVLIPYDLQEAPAPEQAIVMNTSVVAKTLVITKGVSPKEKKQGLFPRSHARKLL